jgi:nucleotide-binding universal stress UspA family protein
MRIDRILFPIDFSDHSRAMNSEVEWLASQFSSHVTLLHVFEVPTSWYGSGEAPLMTGADFMAYADEEKQRLQDYPLQLPENRIQRISAEGSAAWHIAKWTKEHDVDLIVMGTHGYGPVRRLLLGSVAMKVLHDVECPVWTHPVSTEAKSDPKRGISSILCSIELSGEVVPLLRFTKDLAADFAATVHLVHCVPETESRPAKYFDRELHRSLKGWACEEISRLQHEAGTDFPLDITERFIAQDIAELATDQHADLVVIGRGKTQGTFGTLRTNAYEIIRQAPCPVLSFSMEQNQGDSSSCGSRQEVKAQTVR